MLSDPFVDDFVFQQNRKSVGHLMLIVLKIAYIYGSTNKSSFCITRKRELLKAALSSLQRSSTVVWPALKCNSMVSVTSQNVNFSHVVSLRL